MQGRNALLLSPPDQNKTGHGHHDHSPDRRPRRFRARRHFQLRVGQYRLRNGQLDARQGRRPASQRTRDERGHAAPAPGSPQGKAGRRLCDHRARFRNDPQRPRRPARADRLCQQVRVSSVEAAGRCRNRADPGHQGPQRPVQRTGLSAIPGAAAAERFGGPADHRRRLAPAAAADPRRDQCAGVGRDGQPLCLDVARIARGRGRGGAGGRVQGRPQSDRRRPPALLRRQPQPLHDPRTARAQARADRPGAGRQRHRVGPGYRRLLQQQPRLTARRT